MRCPKCKEPYLMATKIESGLSAMGCQRCEGALISLLYYRDWAQTATLPTEKLKAEPVSQPTETSDTSVALSCPKCARLMRKFQISGCHHNRLDLCLSCDDVWLDGGEWEMLKALELSNHMPKIFTDPWQTKVRAQARDEERKLRYLNILGEEDLQKSEDLRSWLKNHPKRQEILFYINHN
ncbi:zf-TFIIB domain-containing protein [Pseudoalteromonas denitrificans]|uniref:Zn-finger domain-containing nucleic acid-binding protein n=1 Tax=Pseudoalteromonas denitrificans DSM 6059 TaxID=1123010 RepID=A0A1I1ERR1_9GAMM|nr:zf-TFIIB domain-containing protein [Pseudoalteromonas denitrificans]SFB88198.1 Zn-finger domain-containing nucleic acid-binding protein [Pseudoalteromonas denitrificans DSM 6059]